ncbi:hypothetical protein PR048_014808 [Dryococelus australis]|uniref:PiggyBac transposable element-derived protein domain-containing protein n=1 Tax=Dryococelus australis TaxID=614101 RepID=A0ABQ9HFD0_9NEOP|nr:hypothetical protein PR048_014808 [Dryococelus australis]
MNQQKAFGMQKRIGQFSEQQSVSKYFFQISRVLRLDSRETRSSRKQNDKFAAIRDLWDIWVETLPKLFNPSAFVTVDEQLVAFRGICPFRQYMPSKPAKYTSEEGRRFQDKKQLLKLCKVFKVKQLKMNIQLVKCLVRQVVAEKGAAAPCVISQTKISKHL